jgi:hypothetical protein
MVAVGASACLVPPSTQVETNGQNVPDPAWAPIYYGVAQVYGTADGFIHIPTYTEPVPAVQGSPSLTDALPTLPNYSGYPVTFGSTWSPSVRLVTLPNGQAGYAMFFTLQVNGHSSCIGVATSTSGQSFTPVNSWTFCAATINGQSAFYGDPDLFVNPSNGSDWLVFANEWSPNGGSEIDEVPIDLSGILSGADSCAYPAPSGDCGILNCTGANCVQHGGAWSAYMLVNYSQMAFVNTTPGNCSYIENPSLTTDDYNYYDLTFSFGTWGPLTPMNGSSCQGNNGTYLTGEVPCLAVNGKCVPAEGGDIMNGDGGTSALVDSSPANNWVIDATWVGNNRVDLAGQTKEVNDNPPSDAQVSQLEAEASPIQYAQPHLTYTPTHWWPRDIDTQTRNDMIGALGPDPGATQTPGCPAATATPISAASIGSPTSQSVTHAETTGGVATTWSDASDAGGCQGPTIPAGASVRVTCKVSGLSMVDGNQTWYRVASSPWNSNYYASADAFYNNGQTAGTLSSALPLEDGQVPSC